MADYKAIKGHTIETVAGDPGVLQAGDIWYSNTTRKIRVGKTQAAAWASGGNLNQAAYARAATGTQTAALAFGGNPAIATTQGYDGTAWSSRPALGTGRGYMMGCGTGTSALGIGGQAPPSGTTATEEFTGETTAANIVTVTTS